MSETLKERIVQRIVRNLLDIIILQMISNQPMWGYKIKKEIENTYGIKIRHGALYPLLNMLENSGYLRSKQEKHGGRIRKVYEITSKGIQYVDAYYNFLKEQLQMKKSEITAGKQNEKRISILRHTARKTN
ncbi:PadR family transcriptional regulator [Candidatus Bathyarchaeota archaeon]|nr:PadR family transcriptional regulator [Candidatus Bathyarchaeota archaeon]